MLITIIIFVIFVYWFTKRIIIQIIRQVDEMLYRNSEEGFFNFEKIRKCRQIKQ